MEASKWEFPLWRGRNGALGIGFASSWAWGSFVPRNDPGKGMVRERIFPDPSRECTDSLWNVDSSPDWSFLVDAVHNLREEKNLIVSPGYPSFYP